MSGSGKRRSASAERDGTAGDQAAILPAQDAAELRRQRGAEAGGEGQGGALGELADRAEPGAGERGRGLLRQFERGDGERSHRIRLAPGRHDAMGAMVAAAEAGEGARAIRRAGDRRCAG